MRSQVTIDLGALRANVRRLVEAAAGAEVWAVVKADGYGHGAFDCADAALASGATALCAATVGEALELLPLAARTIVLGPVANREIAQAREAGLELVVGDGEIPEAVRVHVKLDTGMGRWGIAELPSPTREVVGVMTHLATADSDPEFARLQLERFRAATEPVAQLTRHAANSAAALRIPESRLDAVRCGVALYGLSPFQADPADDGLVPVLSWESEVTQCKLLQPGDSSGYGRRFLAERETWIGIVPVGYGDGFRRGLSGTEVLVDGVRRTVVGTISMDALAVELEDEVPRGTRVTLVGGDLLIEEHARRLGTINYELTCGVVTRPQRARRVVLDS
jgi:alanine racemase